MQKGFVYILTNPSYKDNIIKIGKTGSGGYRERMRFLEANAYYGATGLKRFARSGQSGQRLCGGELQTINDN